MREEDPRLREDDEKRREDDERNRGDDEKRRGDDERNCEYNAGIQAYSAESLMQRTDRLKFSSAKLSVAPIAFKYQ